MSECFWLRDGVCRLVEAEAGDFCRRCRNRITVEQVEEVLKYMHVHR